MATLQRLLRDADERVRKAAADAINKATDELESQVRENMAQRGIKQRSGRLAGSIKSTVANSKRLSAVVSSEVYARIPKRPGLLNPAMRGKYKYGAPYGRILEFSPKFSKYNGFFYTAWYQHRKKIKDDIIQAIGEAWSGKK